MTYYALAHTHSGGRARHGTREARRRVGDCAMQKGDRMVPAAAAGRDRDLPTSPPCHWCGGEGA